MSQVLEILLLLSWSHSCLAADVIQKPHFHIALPMENVTLHCEHDDTSYNTKFWYRQEKGKALVLIGYTVNDALTMETGFTDRRLNIQPNGIKTNVLNISHASAQDSAVYYCASSTTAR